MVFAKNQNKNGSNNMSRKRKFAKPFDLGHVILLNDYPKIYTKSIGVPGKFVKKINRRVHLKDGTGGEMDSAYLADPDYRLLFEKAAVCLEHQSLPVGDEKLYKIGDYDIQLVVDEHLPTLIAIASKEDVRKSKRLLKRTPSDLTELYYLDLGEENIRKRLSTVKKIIDSNQYLTDENALNLGIIALYAPTAHACEITEEVVNLYQKVADSLDVKMQSCLYSLLSVMIDAYFDEENEYRRLMKMIDEKTSSESKYISGAQEAILESLRYAKEDLDIANGKLAKTNDELAKTNDKLIKSNGDLAKSQAKIAELEAEIEKLKANGK